MLNKVFYCSKKIFRDMIRSKDEELSNLDKRKGWRV